MTTPTEPGPLRTRADLSDDLALEHVVGYIRLGPGDSDHQFAPMLQCLTEFAQREGLVLVDVFTDVESSATSGFSALIEALQRTPARAVVLPATQQFARLPNLHLAMKDLLERQTGARVIILSASGQAMRNPGSTFDTTPTNDGARQ